MKLPQLFELPQDDGRGDRLQAIADKSDTAEFLDVLSRHFGSAQSDPRGGVVYLAASDPRLSLRLQDGVIIAVRTHAALPDAELAAIEAQTARACLENTGYGLYSVIILASSPVRGSYRAPGDVFHIAPAPDDAPRPPAPIGDHPFVFQFWVQLSPEEAITRHRSWRRLAEWIWFLNAILTDGVSAGGRSRQRWALCEDWVNPSSSPRDSAWVQDGYHFGGWAAPLELLEVDKTIPVVDGTTYYTRFGSLIDDLEVPDSLDSLVSTFMALEGERRDRFLRAAQWLAAANDLFPLHTGSAFIAQVAAIETLAHKERAEQPCSCCGKDLGPGPTAAFKDFVKEYVPGSVSRRDIDQLYDVRSGLVHGRALLHHDVPDAMHLAFANNEMNVRDRLSRVVSIAMVNWLRKTES